MYRIDGDVYVSNCFSMGFVFLDFGGLMNVIEVYVKWFNVV